MLHVSNIDLLTIIAFVSHWQLEGYEENGVKSVLKY